MRIPVLARYVTLPASAALLALTGCASSGPGGPTAASAGDKATPLKLIKAAYTTTTAAKSAHISISISVEGMSTNSTHAVINGVEDFVHKSSETKTSLAGMGTIEQRQIGSDVYVKISSTMAGAQKLLNTTKPWSHTRIVNDPIPAAVSSIIGGAQADPSALLKLLSSVTSTVTAVGTDDVRGQQSTHYRMTFDEAKIRKLDEQMGNGCGDDEDDPSSDANTPLNVWLDGQGRLTRMLISIDASASSNGTGSTPTSLPSPMPQQNSVLPTITIEFYDYGAPVSIQPPPAEQTQTITSPSGDASGSDDCTSSGSGSASPGPAGQPS